MCECLLGDTQTQPHTHTQKKESQHPQTKTLPGLNRVIPKGVLLNSSWDRFSVCSRSANTAYWRPTVKLYDTATTDEGQFYSTQKTAFLPITRYLFKAPTHQTDFEELVIPMANCYLLSCQLCLGQQSAPDCTTKTTANGQLANKFCGCLRVNTSWYPQVEVICICHSKRETGKL